MTAYEEDAVKVTDEGVPVDSLISVVKDSIKQAGVSQTSAEQGSAGGFGPVDP